jgi:hypothetical protein
MATMGGLLVRAWQKVGPLRRQQRADARRTRLAEGAVQIDQRSKFIDVPSVATLHGAHP